MILPTAVQQHEWMMQWRSAAVELERVRLHELAVASRAGRGDTPRMTSSGSS